jgi:NhaP-type Na+/H+ or K+/H+ antiporter
MSNVAEAFVYTHLGLTFFYTVHKKFSLSFIILEFISIVVARWASIYGVGYLIRDVMQYKNFKMKNNDLSIMSFCGSIRGPISFGLAISMDTPNREIIISGTLVLIFFSTIFFGVLMPKFFSHMESSTEIQLDDLKPALKPTNKEFSFKFMSPNIQKETYIC